MITRRFLIALIVISTILSILVFGCDSHPATIAPAISPTQPPTPVASVISENKTATSDTDTATPSSVVNLGKIVFMSAIDTGNEPQLQVMDVDGSNWKRLTSNMAGDWWPNWSPDGKKIAFNSDRDGNLGIYVMNVDGSNQTILSNDSASDLYSAWSPDGSKITFASSRDCRF